MHVARYVVRAGARQRSVAVVVRPEEMGFADTLLELLEAAGAAKAQVVSGAPVPEADVVLVSRHRSAGQGDAAQGPALGASSRSAGAPHPPLDPLADFQRASLASSLGPLDPRAAVWAIDVERLAGPKDARI